MKNMTVSMGELTTDSNLPKGRQIFINDEKHKDLACLFNWEKNQPDFDKKEQELKELANLFIIAPKMKDAILKVVEDFHNGNIQNNPSTETRTALIELAKLIQK